MTGVMVIPAFLSLVDFDISLSIRKYQSPRRLRKGGLHLLKDDKTKYSKGQSSQNG